MTLYTKRIIKIGASILGSAFITGIIMCWYKLRGVSLTHEDGILIRGTILPVVLMFYLFFITIPIIAISGILVFIAVKKQKLWWLSIIGFILFALYWLVMAFISSILVFS